MSCSYLTHNASRVEEHAEAKITAGHDGKSFRLRSDGILNRNFSSVKHFLAQDKKRNRHIEKVDCTLLSITEGCHWLLRYPTVITNEMNDKIALFNMRPPELLCIDSVGLYFQSFDQQKHSFSNQTLRLMFQAYTLAPWIDCFGHWIRLRRAPLKHRKICLPYE